MKSACVSLVVGVLAFAMSLVSASSALAAWSTGVGVDWISQLDNGTTQIYLANSVSCGAYSGRYVHIMSDDVGADDAERLARMLLAAHLAGRVIDLDLHAFSAGGQHYCSVRRVKLY